MIVLRLTAAGQVHDVSLPTDQAVLGSAPNADVTLQQIGWRPAMARCRLDASGRGLIVERLDGSGSKVLLQAGQCMALGDALVEWVAPDTDGSYSDGSYSDGNNSEAEDNAASKDGVLFGGYEDDPTARPTSSIAEPMFALESSAPEGVVPQAGIPEARIPEAGIPEAGVPEAGAPTAQVKAPASANGPAPRTDAPSPRETPSPQAKPAGPDRSRVPTPAEPPALAANAPDPTQAKRSGRRTARAARVSRVGTRDAQPQLVPAQFPDGDLGAELVRTVKRAPFFVGSAMVHLLVFLLLTMLWDTTEPEPEMGIGSLRSSFSDIDADIGDPDEPDESDPLTPMDFESTDFDELLEQPKEEAPKSPQPSEEQQLQAELDDLTQDTLTEPQIGILPSDGVFRGRTPKLRKPTVAPSKLGKSFAGNDALKTNRRVADLVRNMVRGRSGGPNGVGLDDILEGDILVVKATFDHMDIVLRALSVPFESVVPLNLTGPDALKLSKYKVIFWNCGKPLHPTAMRKVKGKLKRFVSRGGYLFTTDWAVGGILRHAFPGYLTTQGKVLNLPERVVDIRPRQASQSNPLLEGVFQKGSNGRWWLEKQSFDIAIGPSGEGIVEVLIEAPELSDVWNVNSAVAATFTYGRGRVLHVMGHYYQQAGNVAGTMASHRLALNFVLEQIGKVRAKR